MKIKGYTDGRPFEFEENIAAAISRLCDFFTGYNPVIEEEEDAVIATSATQTVLFRGTPNEVACLKEASKLVIAKHDELSKSRATDSPSSYLVRREMERLKIDIIASMTFRTECAPKSTLQEAYSKIGS